MLPARSRAPTSPRLGSRPRASDAAPGLSTRTMPMARFSEPDSGPTTSATLRRTGNETRVVVTRPLAGRRFSPRRVCRRASLSGLAQRRAALAALSEEGVARGPAESRRGSAPVTALESPARPGPRTSVSRARPSERRNPSDRRRAHPMPTLAGRASRGLRSRTCPRRPMRSHEDRGAFDRRSARPFEEIALPARSSGPPVHATRPPSIKKSVRAFATWSASASFAAP